MHTTFMSHRKTSQKTLGKIPGNQEIDNRTVAEMRKNYCCDKDTEKIFS